MENGKGEKEKMTISLENESGIQLAFPYEELAHQVVEAAMDHEDFPYEAEVNILLVTEEEIQEINRLQRNIDAVTDVLSFPMLNLPAPGDFSRLEEEEDNFHPETGEALLGDIVLCIPKVIAQAAEFGHSEKREYAFLLLHSMLHLFGYDHMTPEEAEVMEGKQRTILEQMGISR